MATLPSIAPRLVFAADDVDDIVAHVTEEHAALVAELHSLEVELATMAETTEGWERNDEQVRAVTSTLEELYGTRRTARLAELDAAVTDRERTAAAHVMAAEQEMAHHLAAVRSEVGDRLVAEAVDHASPPPVAAAEGTAVLVVTDGAEEALQGLHLWHDLEQHTAAWADQGGDTDRFRAFWSEQDEIASVREAIAAPLVAVAPMALALLVIVVLLMLVI